MKKYFSSGISSHGYRSTFNMIYRKQPSSRVILAYNGTDFERAVFFKRLTDNFKGYNLTLFNPFFDESIDGIYIKNLDTYIVSDSGYSRLSPLLSGIWEKQYCVTKEKNIPTDLRREMLIFKIHENNCYKKAYEILKNASSVKEKMHIEFAPYLNDDKIINFVRRFCGKHLKSNMSKGFGEIRLLSSPTPLGIHTHYDTIFDNCENIVSICDDYGFVGSIILGIIRDFAVSEGINFIMSPSYYAKDIVQTLIFPEQSLAITINDENHILPFEPQEKITISRFLTSDHILSSPKLDALISIENKLLENCVINLYDGRDYRFKYNDLCKGYECEEEAKTSADILTKKFMT